MSGKTFADKLTALTLMVLLFAAISYVLTAIKYLPDDPLANALPYIQTSAAARSLLLLAATVGLLAVIWKAEGTEQPSVLLLWVGRGWQVLVVLVLLAVTLNMLDGRVWLELPPLLDGLVLALFGLGLLPLRSVIRRDGRTLALAGTLLLIVVCLLAGLIAPAHPVQEIVLRMLAAGLLIQAALPAAALLAASRGNPEQDRIAAGALLAGGGLTALAPAQALGWLGASPVWSLATLLLALVFLWCSSAGTRWTALANMLLGAHLLTGALLLLPEFAPVLHGTTFSVLQGLLPLSAVLLLLIPEPAGRALAALITVGTAGGVLLLAAVGVGQVYLERVFSIGYLDSQAALVPLYTLWIGSVLLLALGMLALLIQRIRHRTR